MQWQDNALGYIPFMRVCQIASGKPHVPDIMYNKEDSSGCGTHIKRKICIAKWNKKPEIILRSYLLFRGGKLQELKILKWENNIFSLICAFLMHLFYLLGWLEFFQNICSEVRITMKQWHLQPQMELMQNQCTLCQWNMLCMTENVSRQTFFSDGSRISHRGCKFAGCWHSCVRLLLHCRFTKDFSVLPTNSLMTSMTDDPHFSLPRASVGIKPLQIVYSWMSL